MIKLEELAQELGINKRTIERNYLAKRIPAPVKDYKGWRWYDAETAGRVREYFIRIRAV